MVFDEQTDEWKRRFGFDRAGDSNKVGRGTCFIYPHYPHYGSTLRVMIEHVVKPPHGGLQ
jgi:hypothetical protein